jgi:hypothetical protein
MREGLLRRHLAELVARPSAERAARGGEDERVDLVGSSILQALEGGGVLAVDGQEPPPSPRLGGERELAGGHEALLVRKREIDAPLERPERDRQPGEADDGVEHDVVLGTLEQLGRVSSDLSQRREAVDRR